MQEWLRERNLVDEELVEGSSSQNVKLWFWLIKAITISVGGKVQGVGFRYFTCRKAKSLGLTGWVRNESNGTVSIHAEGLQENLEALFYWTKKGPSTSYVRDIKIEWVPFSGLFIDFIIKY